MEYIEPQDVIRIEGPHTFRCKNDIPHNEQQSGDEGGQSAMAEFAVKLNPWMKREQKRHQQAAEINKQVCEVRDQDCLNLSASVKYFIGTHSIPKHSPSSFPRCL